MRRINSVLLALTLVSATAVTAQRTGQPPQHGEHAAMGRRGGPGEFLGAALRGIELTPTQQEQIHALHQQFGPPGDAVRGRFGGAERGDSLRRGQRPQGPPRGDSARASRRSMARGDSIRGNRPRPDFPMRGDTAQMRERRAQMEAQRDQLLAQVRSILTTTQRQQFDQNLQTLEQRRKQRLAR